MACKALAFGKTRRAPKANFEMGFRVAWNCRSWLVTLHPFEDGIGRITRAVVTDLALAQAEGRSDFLYRMSARINDVKGRYDAALDPIQALLDDIISLAMRPANRPKWHRGEGLRPQRQMSELRPLRIPRNLPKTFGFPSASPVCMWRRSEPTRSPTGRIGLHAL